MPNPQQDKWMANALGVRAALDTRAGGSASPGQQQDKKQRVKALRDERKQMQAEYDKLAAYKLPDERAADMQASLTEVQSLLKDTSKDAAARAKQIQEYVEKAKKLHPDDPKLAAALKKISDIAGKVGKGVAGAAEKMEKLNEWLDRLQEVLEQFQKSFQISETGSASDQLKDFKGAFDRLRKVPGVDEIPGLSEMFDIYSQAIGAIAESAKRIEAEVKSRNEMAQKAGDFGPNESLYIRLKSQREKLADRRKELAGQIAAKDQELEQEADEDETARPVSRKEMADRICAAKCSGFETEWRNLDGRAKELEQRAAEEAKSLKQEQTALAQARPDLEKEQSALAGVEKDLNEFRTHYAARATPEQMNDLTKKQETARAGHAGKVTAAKQKIARHEANIVRLSATAQRAAEAGRTARAAANKAKADYDACRRDCYRNALAAGDITEMPEGLDAKETVPAQKGGAGSAAADALGERLAGLQQQRFSLQDAAKRASAEVAGVRKRLAALGSDPRFARNTNPGQRAREEQSLKNELGTAENELKTRSADLAALDREIESAKADAAKAAR